MARRRRKRRSRVGRSRRWHWGQLLAGAALGGAAGFAVARLAEARAAGVPARAALTLWYAPVAALKADAEARARPPAAPTNPLDPDAVLPPSEGYG